MPTVTDQTRAPVLDELQSEEPTITWVNRRTIVLAGDVYLLLLLTVILAFVPNLTWLWVS